MKLDDISQQASRTVVGVTPSPTHELRSYSAHEL